jgi:uncharacterized protein (TIGR02599 family)
MSRLIRSRSRPGFTLVEMLVSMAVLALLMVIIMEMINRTQQTVTRQQARAEEFKEARAAMDAISRSLSGTVINSYWAYGDSSVGGKVNYTRQSDGHFVAGPATILRGKDQNSPGHAMFFQSSDGQTRLGNSTTGLGDPYNLITCMGYYVDYQSDENLRPDFLAKDKILNPERSRFRLMELRLPPEKNILYSTSLNINGTGVTRENAFKWFRGPFTDNTTTLQNSTVLAENILALILVPRYVAVTTTGSTGESSTGGNQENTLSNTKPAADYYYDSRESQWGATATEKSRNTAHQLPPVVQVTLVAAEERSYAELEIRMGEKALAEAVNAAFANKFTTQSQFTADMNAVEEALSVLKLKHRVFTTNVAIRGSKWIVEERSL